ncbi:transmembrane amino acid transporter protein-domain-containing protein [Lentinula detonsa]|uniref:Transmembrane amino acid transporter protein-domain-containing protein n=1 Tax=Lentinula detonsa TaxID=2804962 RepID=A0A9W8U2I4_9AGAR|nr:transmembrane amino acid transporter protein-domain-containing protein [Lentinula detonsa]
MDVEFDRNREVKVSDFEETVIQEQDVFDESPEHDIRYKTLSWQFVTLLMISEIVSNGMLSLPSSLAVIGIAPALILIVFLGVFGLFTAKLLIDFKLHHPSVHSMYTFYTMRDRGDAGYIIGGPILREVLGFGTIIFAIFATGGELISGQQALSILSNDGICSVFSVLIFAAATFLLSLPRTLGNLSWLGLFSTALIVVSGIVGMVGAGASPVPGRIVGAAMSNNFYEAFLAVTNPVFSYAGHFMRVAFGMLIPPMEFIRGLGFFILISEMRRPQDAMKAAWCLQGFATIFYTLFALVVYLYPGNTVESPAFLSLSPKWAKAAFAIALGNFLIAGALYIHTAAKLLYVRNFRHTRHISTHTILGWSIWIILCLGATATAFVLAVTLPIFSYLIGITASLFAAWYTYGLAGFFWLHDTYHSQGGRKALVRRPLGTTVAILTILAGAFTCVVGTYVSVQLIINAYREGIVGSPFIC